MSELKLVDVVISIKILDVEIEELFQDLYNSILLDGTDEKVFDVYKNRIKNLYDVKSFLKSKL